MSQADILLNTLSEGDVVGYGSTPVEEYIVIGSDRIIKIPTTLKRIGVEHDHNVETVTFKCPRYWDNHDLSEMQIYINYLLPDGKPGRYLAEDIVFDEAVMYFTWTISKHVTQKRGSISFLVCAMRVDEEGVEQVHWNSELNQEMYISEGLEVENDVVVSSYPDIIAQLLTRMTNVENVAIKKSELETITKLRRKTEGTVVQVDDVSTAAHLTNVDVQVKSKNVLVYTDDMFESSSGYISTCTSDGACVVSGSVTTNSGVGQARIANSVSDDRTVLDAGKPYIISIYKDGEPFDIQSDPYSSNVQLTLWDMRNGGNKTTYHSALPISIEPSDKQRSVRNILINYSNAPLGDASLCGTYTIQIEEGEVSTAYTPYIDPATAPVTVCGKNLFPLSLPDNNTIEVKSTVGNDYQLIYTGQLPPGSYVFTAAYNQSNYRAYPSVKIAGNGPEGEIVYGEKRGTSFERGIICIEFTIPEGYEYNGLNIYFCSNNSDTSLNTTCYFRSISVTTDNPGYSLTTNDHEYYSGTDYMSDPIGQVHLKHSDAIMTVFSPWPGVRVEVDYIRDTATVVNEMHSKIDSLLERIERLENA